MKTKSFFRIKKVLNGTSGNKFTYDYISVIGDEQIGCLRSNVLYDNKAEILSYIMFLKEAIKSFDVVITNLKVREREGHFIQVTDRHKDHKFEIKCGLDNELVATSIRNYRKQSHALFEIDNLKYNIPLASIKYE